MNQICKTLQFLVSAPNIHYLHSFIQVPFIRRLEVGGEGKGLAVGSKLVMIACFSAQEGKKGCRSCFILLAFAEAIETLCQMHEFWTKRESMWPSECALVLKLHISVYFLPFSRNVI